MKVSIIVPIYNVEQYVADCLQSIIVQDYADLECILVNDCTPDQSMRVVSDFLAEYSGPITFTIINQDRNGGISLARNKGIEVATGDYVLFMDSDDYFLAPSAVSTFAKYALQYPDADVITGHWTDQNNQYNSCCTRQVIVEAIDKKKSSNLFLHYYGTAWNRLIKKSFLFDYNLWFDEGLLYEDSFWCLKSFPFLDKHVVIPEVTYFYRPNPSGVTKGRNNASKFKSRIKLVEVLFNSRVEKEFCNSYYYNIAYNLLASACIMTELIALDRQDVSAYVEMRHLFVKQIMFLRPIWFYVGMMLFKPFRLFLKNGIIRKKAFTLLLKNKPFCGGTFHLDK